MRYAVLVKNNLGDISLSQKYYLKAHEYAVDKKIFDKWCWYIEKAISVNYARLNENDRAIYFARLVENNLILAKDFGKLGRLYSDLGNLYLWIDDEVNAKYYYKSGLKESQKVDNYLGVIGNSLNLAKFSRLESDFDTSEEYRTIGLDAINKLEEGKEKIIRFGNYWIESGDFYKQISAYDKAIESYYTAYIYYNQAYKGLKSREKAKILVLIGNCELSRNNICDANEAFSEGMFNIGLSPKISFLSDDQLFKENTIVELLEFKSKIYYENFIFSKEYIYIDSAIYCLEIAFGINDKLHNDLLATKSKLISISYNKTLVSLGLKYLFEKSNRQDSSFVTVNIENEIKPFFDRSKSIYLLEELNIKRGIRNLSNEIQIEIIEIQSNMRDLVEKRSTDLIGLSDFESKYLMEKEKLNKLTKDLPKLTLLEIHSPYVEFAETDNGEYYSLNNFELPYFRKLKNVNKDSIIKLTSMLKDQSYEPLLNELLDKYYNVVLPTSAINQERLTIVPDGSFNLFPFDALRHNEKYLIEILPLDFKVKRKSLKRETSKVGNKKLYCVSPNYQGSEQETLRTLNTEISSKLSTLEMAKLEAEKIEATWKGEFASITDIGFEKMITDASEFDVFHYAGHSVLEGDSSYLALINEGRLEKAYADMILYWPHNFDMVVLSACETGVGSFKKGEGIQSLANSFAIGGANTLVSSLWSINDMSTSQIMSSFYEGLNEGKTPQVALQLAKIKYLSDAPPIMRHPFYWSGFVVNTISIHNESKFKVDISFIIIALSLLLFALIISFLRNRYFISE